MNYNPGTQIGDYQILAVLGTGGMGKVYKVRNVISDRVEAMKILLPDLANQQALADRFLREIKVLASLNHPNIAALHTALRVENQLLMVMELVEGVTLADKLQAGTVPLQEGLNDADQALAALSYAHRQGVIHRDIKPANMMLTPQGVLKLMDFGIARAPSDTKLTMTGTTLGSLHYMSPEQVKGGPLDARSDLYSLGVVLYEIVTGKRPFQEASEYSVMAAHLEKVPQAPIEINPNLPPSLNEVILLALAKDPAQRFQSADAFRNALANVSGAAGAGVAAAQVAPPDAGMASAVGMSPPARTQTTPSPQSPIPASISQAGKSGGYRGLYMTLGALLVVLVIVASAIELPRWLKARAGAKDLPPASTQSSPAPASASTSQPAASDSSTSPALSSAAAPTEASSSSAASSQAPTSNAPPSNTATAPATVDATLAKPAAKLHHAIRKTRPRVENGTQGSAPSVAVSAGAAATTPPAASPQTSASGQDTSTTEQPGPVMEKLQDRLDRLSSRAQAVDQSLKTLQQQQASSGLNLRGDVTASWIRMKGLLDRADNAMAANRPFVAKLNMDRAEREIDFLETFLGR
jgi:eukaryotic-like serine/threonine-protein kinase